jgi:L-ascorbate metabolism protein UlaG (beta-lactamase superfamily)
MTNLGFEDLVQVIEQVKPPIVIPMHYDAPGQADLFAQSVEKRYPVRRIKESRLTLSRTMLPKTTEVFIITHPRPLLRWE